jgi:glucokinase
MRILAGDIGGTKSFLAIFESDGARLVPVREERFESRRFDGLTSIVRSFLSGDAGAISAASFGIAGPIADDECRALNLPWTVNRGRLAEEIGIARTMILNDFQAVGHGLTELTSEDLVCLQEGTPRPGGPIALIGAGTGLGEGFLIREDARYRVHPSEGGHVDFAPRDETEWRLHRRLSGVHGHVSYERILSGSGLHDLYRFFVEDGIAPESKKVRAEMETNDPAAVVTSHALSGDDLACARALDLFVSIYGAEAGNLALKVMASGGVYIAGGIAPRIVPALRDGTLIRSFLDKGRHAALLSAVPVHVIVNEKAGLLGAAALAAEIFRSA